jgi:hypothetical protein
VIPYRATSFANVSLYTGFLSSENKNANPVSAYLAFSRIPLAVRALSLGSPDYKADKMAMPRHWSLMDQLD